ncbi:MAG TPA: C1 family peptidase [Anaerolineaceae bacterium]|nr:C1 family peptidase [Anaerolineaceae bacterium]
MSITHSPEIDLTEVRPSKKTQAEKKHRSLQGELVQKNARWQAKQTPQSYLTLAQKKALLGITAPDKEFKAQIKSAGLAPRAFFPSFDPEVDWRTKNGGKISPVKDQGTCGSCVSFGTIGLLEAMTLIEKGILLDLSEADLHFCSSHGASCIGWYPAQALQSIQQRGVTDELHFPYSSAFSNGAPQCILAPDRAQHLYNIQSTSWNVIDLFRKDYLTHNGPMVACMDVYDDFFSYGGGIYHHVSGQKEGGHCILVVGYSESQKCWICKNSWGTAWGEAGFFNIAYQECNIDSILAPFFGAQGVVLPA